MLTPVWDTYPYTIKDYKSSITKLKNKENKGGTGRPAQRTISRLLKFVEGLSNRAAIDPWASKVSPAFVGTIDRR